MKPALDAIRFAPERELIDGLFEKFALEDPIAHYVGSGQARDAYDEVLGSALRLTPVLSPRLCTLLAETRERLAFTEPVELFVEPDAGINAAAAHALSDDHPHAILLTSGAVERMSDAELRFVLGHELGHLHFRHYRALLAWKAIGTDAEGDTQMPALLVARMASWDRLAELSADRAGFVAVDGHLDTIVSAFFKLASGLGPEHLRFELGAFLDQLADLQRMKRREVLALFSHPVTPVRVKALQLFAPHGRLPLRRGAAAKLREVDAEVRELARILDYEATEPLDTHARDFLLSAGLIAGNADDEHFTDEEWEYLMTTLLPLTQDPEAHLEQLRDAASARRLLDESAAWLAENAGEERFTLFRQLAHLVAVDGRLHPEERRVMVAIAAQLGIPEKSARETMYEVLAGYLQTRRTSNAAQLHRFGRGAP